MKRGIILYVTCAALVAMSSAGEFPRPQHCSYRSFMKELAATRRFADGGMELRCFTVGNTMNSIGEPYCEYPVVWYFAPGISNGKTLDAMRVERLTGCPFGGDRVEKRDFSNWRSVYVPNYEKDTLDAERFAILLKESGAHSYVDFPSVVHANKRLVSVHLKDGGKRVLRLPRRVAKVTELISGRVVAEGTNSFEYEFMSPDTRIFEVEN